MRYQCIIILCGNHFALGGVGYFALVSSRFDVSFCSGASSSSCHGLVCDLCL